MTTLPSNPDATEQHTAQILAAAAGTGDLATVREILTQWPLQPGSRPAPAPYSPDLWPFGLVCYTAIEKNKSQIVSYVLGLGLKLERLAVERALDAESLDIFQAFIDNGWDINAPLGEIEPPPLARVITNETLVRWFLSHGADPNVQAPRLARTPIMAAGAHAPLPLVQLLYAHGASHLDVLQSAAESPTAGRLPVMEFLLDDGADIDAVKWQHHPESYESFKALELGTALHYAAKNGYADRVEFLLMRGAKTDVLDSTGKTALDLAREYRRDNTTTLLSRHRQHNENY